MEPAADPGHGRIARRDGRAIYGSPWPRSHSRPSASQTGRATPSAATGSFAGYELVGRALHDVVVQSVPAGWTWGGKRVLDFGCGAGRTMRHFVPESAEAEVWGCDIDAPSVEWVNANLNPPFAAFVNAAAPPLARPDDSFDLIYAFSVFTHITDQWSAWLVEMHRVLAPGGILIASFSARACRRPSPESRGSRSASA